jgi:hypothetical protein
MQSLPGTYANGGWGDKLLLVKPLPNPAEAKLQEDWGRCPVLLVVRPENFMSYGYIKTKYLCIDIPSTAASYLS